MTKAKNPTKKARAKAWAAFSKFIRARDCVLTCGTTDYGKCCTCGKVFEYGRLQAGHFIPGRNNAILFDPRCVHAQCVGCNIYANGRQPVYYQFMIEKYGRDAVDELFRQANLSMKLTEQDYQDYADRFNRWAKEIERNQVVSPGLGLEFVAELRFRLGMAGTNGPV